MEKPKITQEDIDELLKSSDQEEQEEKPKGKNHKKDNTNNDNEDYSEQFQKDENENMEEVIEQQPEYEQQYDQDIQEKGDQHLPVSKNILEDQNQVKSEIQEEPISDEVDDELEKSKFKKDDDLSEAKSEFIESSKLNMNINQFKKKSSKNILQPKKDQSQKINKQTKNPAKKQATLKQTSKTPQTSKKPDTAKKMPKSNRTIEEAPENKERKKLSESQIKQKMKAIQAQKEAILKKKEEKKQKIDQQNRKQYEEAKKLQDQRKQKNKKIFQEQLKKKKEGTTTKKQIKINDDELKLPQKKTDYKYMEMNAERKQNQNKIKKIIDQENKLKLKTLKDPYVKADKPEVKKAKFLEQRNLIKQKQVKLRNLQAKQEDTLIIKQLKKEINQCRKFNEDKKNQINRADKYIADLTKALKEKEKIAYLGYAKADKRSNQVQTVNYSELSPVEQFVQIFNEAKNSEEIFNILDENRDGQLSIEQIKNRLFDLQVKPELAQTIYTLLDQNSDGHVSLQEFVFIIDLQLKKQRDYRARMGEIQFIDPLEIQAKILDMRTKINYINQKIQNHSLNNSNEVYTQKFQKLQNKLKKIEDSTKVVPTNEQNNMKAKMNIDVLPALIAEANRLKNQKDIQNKLLQTFRIKFKENTTTKNRHLIFKVEENLKLKEEIYQIKNEIQQTQLRYLSLKRIEQNKKGYLQRQSKQRKQLQETYRKAKEYQRSITDPTNKLKAATYAQDVRFLAAVIMIQRNYRKKRAMREFQKLKK